DRPDRPMHAATIKKRHAIGSDRRSKATSGLAHSTRCKHANASQYIKRMRKLAGSSADTADSRLRVKQGLVLPFQLFQLCLFLNCTRPKLENSDRKQGKTNQSEPR